MIIPVDKIVYIFPIGHVSALNFALGLTLGVALFCIGAGAVHWARTLMSDEEIADERHPIEADARGHARRSSAALRGTVPRSPRFGRRKLIRNTMFGALALVPLSGVVLLRDLGPLPEDEAAPHRCGPRASCSINMNTNEPLRPEDVVVGSLTFAKPEGLEEERRGLPDSRSPRRP